MKLDRYTVKPDKAAKNEELVRAVHDELLRTRPAGTRRGRGRYE
jgi:hypothetical protein